MAQDRYANNTTSYVHPQESNLLNIHKVMQYNSQGQPVARVHVDGINLEGDVIVDTVSLSSSTLAALESINVQNTVSVTVSNFPTTTTVYQGTNPWISTITNWPAVQYVSGTVYTVQSGTWAVGVTGTVSVNNFTSTVNVASIPAISGTVAVSSLPAVTGTVSINNSVTITNTSFAITNFPTTSTVYQGTNPWTITGTVNIGTMPEVEIKNDIGNPIPVSKNTTTNSITNPIYVSNEGSQVVVGDLPAPSLTAFDEPLAVGITPVIQADAMYGLDPDFWTITELNSGTVSVTTNTTWQVQSGTNPGGYARLASSKYMTYQPGQGSMFRWTAAFTTGTVSTSTAKHALGVDSIVQNTGPIDREDGYSFGYSGSTANDASRKIGILHRRAGRAETRKLTITTAPTGNQTAIVTLDGVAYSITLTASTSVEYTANQIANKLKAITTATNTWDIEGCNGHVTFTYYSPGARSGTYSFTSTGAGTLAIGTFSQIYAGATPSDIWTYVDQWDNQDIEFDPTKLNVFGIDFRWLGAGRVRFFMEDPISAKFVLVHTLRWAGNYIYPHLNKPSLRLIYRSGTTNLAVTPSKNVVVTGASIFAGIQGMINQTGGSQGWFDIDSTTRVKDTVWHLMSIQNPYVRNDGVNKASIIIQTLTVAVQATDPSVVYIVKNATGVSDVLVFQNIPNNTPSMFAQYSVSVLSENLSVDRLTNIQTVGINGTAQFDLIPYNLSLSPGETVSFFISSSNAINRSAVGVTWKVD